ncbi:MAG: RnfH family protein [Salipiger thiooxidans]|jgi:putative ubiquitin-RnfH superfamily antitoxin RatB of RatAB toxin-antitoxin module|uniref:RnfH family protein n=1 Tax=Salipiger thiooxidans TaxID=282683 RepID=UPI001A9073C5|nr:RnfH family protein [Salipiger thiooxidans]MBN8188928.1 RnfH family protein [Salipiger thiooxidans]
MNVGIAYAKPTAQIWRSLTIAEGATVRDVIEASGLLDQFPELDLETNKVGIFGTVARLDKPVKEGDRVEIYRPIHPDAELLEKKR